MQNGKRVLITGVNVGIGLATAKLFAAKGYQVVGSVRSLETISPELKAALKEEPIKMVQMELTDATSVERGYSEAVAILGAIDILINNAGIGELGAVEDTDLVDSRKLFEVNYFSPVTLIKKVLPGMRERGHGAILNLGSIVHDLQFPFKAQYCASKSALTGFTLALRYEVYPYGIRVHLFEPGWVRSAFHKRMQPVLKPASPYQKRLKPFLDFSRDTNPNIPNGDAVALVILQTLENPNAPVRVAVGAEAKKFRIARRLLSNRMLDRLLLWKLAKKGEGDSAVL